MTKNRKTLAGIAIYTAFRGVAFSSFQVLLPLYLVSIGYRVADLGPLATYATVATAVFLPFIGHMVDAGHPVTIGTLSGIVLALSLIVPTISSSYLAFVIVYILNSLALMMWQPARISVVGRIVRSGSLGRTYAVFTAGFNIARIVTPFIAVAIAHMIGYRSAMALMSVFPLVGALIYCATARHVEIEKKKVEIKSLFQTYKNVYWILKRYPYLSLFSFFDIYGWRLWFPMLNAYLKKAVGLDDMGVGLYNSLFSASMLASSYPSGILTDRMGPRKVLALNEVLGIVAAILLAQHMPILAYIASIAMGISIAFWINGYNTITTLLMGPEKAGIMRSSIDAARTIVSVPAPALGSAIYSSVSISAPFYLGTVFMGLAALSILYVKKGRDKEITG